MPFQNNEIQVSFAAELPPQLPIMLPGSINLGQIQILANIPLPEGDRQIATVLIEPISVRLSGPLVVDTTVRITFSDQEQQTAVQTLQNLFREEGGQQLKLLMTVPVNIAGIQVYSGMPLEVFLTPSNLSSGGSPLALLGPSDPTQQRTSALRQRFQESDILDLGSSFGIVWDSLNMNFNDQGLKLGLLESKWSFVAL
jgi:hypothetical protein